MFLTGWYPKNYSFCPKNYTTGSKWLIGDMAWSPKSIEKQPFSQWLSSRPYTKNSNLTSRNPIYFFDKIIICPGLKTNSLRPLRVRKFTGACHWPRRCSFRGPKWEAPGIWAQNRNIALVYFHGNRC